MNDNTRQGEALRQLIAAHSSGRSRRRWIWLAVIFLTLAGAAAGYFMRSGNDAARPRFKTEAAAIGQLVVRISATGNLEPTNQVDVGSELSGIVDEVLVDINDRVQEGQVVARLNTATLQDAVTRSKASLAMAEAQVVQMRATLSETRTALNRYRDVSRLSGGKAPARTEMDAAEAAFRRAEANVASAEASVVQSKAELRSAETNLSKASIRSPISGVVLKRKIEPGQTVAASFEAPVLFTLAENLSTMKLQVDVDEADVGKVSEGQSATFTVDAWPGRQYNATVTRVSYGAQTKDGVVSYLTVLAVTNEDLSLRPGMTGNAEITTLTRDKVLLVPNAALRFTPPTGDPAKQSSDLMDSFMPRPPQPAPKTQAVNAFSPHVWVLRGGLPEAVAIRTGATNGYMTEVTGGELREGMEVITESLVNAS
ncbi:efflux RND transporter periplasmic adaptor subunit [Desulfomicrobium orale]|uniref:Efflux transporter periplasmic adaptor subunit n=1 Tax=Desulfomicrobium orale DSM 12838 TaxID=888061 RepID=A0A0X8JNU1_9BACT|nr:efflux RND transporter periplasmic adaptor subunit [Desulfomicrobium orale]AMD92219.1 efflux transporter periplasmic adaptor subunit [Desulfomicrobium orale DSM 12838]